ncbi:glycosyltransferase family 2 protein [Scytonema sp. NUACC26]|uniref:glycosyltransferase family 2 protein n=1 Tax=Scytonema sp. NUACC26 TaxID=3140176 RepID=UPI0034DBA85B
MQKLQTEKLQPIQLSPLPDNPLVSVLVPNYNYAKYIGEALDSVLRQTYPYFEVLVCDDGSADNSCEIIETYVRKDVRIKLIRKQNGGVATALNQAYRESKGEIICLLDADDVWMENKLQKVLEVFRSYLECGFAIHNVIQIDGQGNLLKSTPHYHRLTTGWMAPFALENGGFVYYLPAASALSVRREVANLIFPLNETFRSNADSLFSRLAPLITVIRAVPEVLSQFRFHGANTTSLVNVTAERLEREEVVFERLHQEQKRFLRDVYGTSIAEKLTDLKFSVLFCNARYLAARLKGKPKKESREVYQQLVTHPRFHDYFGDSLLQKWLVQWGEYLPNALFTAFFDQVYGSGSLKRLAKWLFKRKLTVSSIHG